MSSELLTKTAAFVAACQENGGMNFRATSRSYFADVDLHLTSTDIEALLSMARRAPTTVEVDGSLDACFTAFGLAHRLYRENQALKARLK